MVLDTTERRSPLIVIVQAAYIPTSRAKSAREMRSLYPSLCLFFTDALVITPQRFASLPGSEAFELDVAVAILSEGGLDCALEADFVVLVELDELEGLQSPGNRAQHFRSTQD